MSLGTFVNTDITTAIDAAGVEDLILTLVSQQFGIDIMAVFDKFDTALIAFGEAARTDILTDRVTFSAGSKAVIDRVRNASPTDWTPYAPFIRNAQALLDGLIATVDGASAGVFAPLTAVTQTAPDSTTLGTNIVSQSNQVTTGNLVILRQAFADALEAFDPLCVPARAADLWTFGTVPKAVMTCMSSATPTVGYPTAIFQRRYDALLAAFNAGVLPGVAVTPDVAVI
jgi:hypothetical protein